MIFMFMIRTNSKFGRALLYLEISYFPLFTKKKKKKMIFLAQIFCKLALW